MLGVSAQCCVMADDDIASQHQPHMLPSPKRLQAEHRRAALEQPLLLIFSAQPPPGHCTPSTLLSRIPHAALTTCPLRRRRRHLPLYARNSTAHSRSRPRDKELIVCDTAPSRNPHHSIACRPLRPTLILHNRPSHFFFHHDHGRRRGARFPSVARARVRSYWSLACS